MDTLTINEDLKNKEDLVEIVWRAMKYFPQGIWEGEGIEYLGNVILKHDLKIELNKKTYGGFLLKDLIKKLREMKKRFKSEKLLLALTHDPVILIYYQFDERYRIVRKGGPVHDFVLEEMGIVSFFEIEEESGIKVTAHGLGHNQGLVHHAEPIDLMYGSLLNEIKSIKKDGFCKTCQEKLKEK